MFLVQNMYDAAQIKVSNVLEERLSSELTGDQWLYLLKLGESFKETLNNANSS